MDFAHGTSLENAQNIMNGGLNADAARAATTGGLYSKLGSFFTFNATEYGNDTVQNAYEQGFTQSDKPVILMVRLPQSVFDELTAGGGVYVGRIPGIDIPETVFGPETFDQLNRSMEWYEEPRDPYRNSR